MNQDICVACGKELPTENEKLKAENERLKTFNEMIKSDYIKRAEKQFAKIDELNKIIAENHTEKAIYKEGVITGRDLAIKKFAKKVKEKFFDWCKEKIAFEKEYSALVGKELDCYTQAIVHTHCAGKRIIDDLVKELTEGEK